VGLTALCGLSCSGSGDGKLNPVQGKVLYRNQPLSGALVTLHPKDSKDLNVTPPTGLTKEDGTFTVTTGRKDGAAAGEYVVTIICSEEVENKKKTMSTAPPESRDRLNGAYANRDASRITVKITNGTNQLEPWDLK
jgi:hypothetical protein